MDWECLDQPGHLFRLIKNVSVHLQNYLSFKIILGGCLGVANVLLSCVTGASNR